MGIEEPIELVEVLDEGVLKWPKHLLASIYVALNVYSCSRIYFSEMYQEEFVTRLICIALFLPLCAFIMNGRKWAMSSAYTVLLCYFGAFYLLVGLTVSIGLLGFVVFMGVLTLRAMTAVDQAGSLTQKMNAEIFE